MFGNILRSILGVVQILLGPKIADYFEARGDQARQDKREAKARMAKTIVDGVFAYVSLTTTAEQQARTDFVNRLVEESYRALVENNFSQRMARGIAEREIAKILGEAKT